MNARPYFSAPRGSLGEPIDPRAEMVHCWVHDCPSDGPTATAAGQECPWCGAREGATVTIEPDVPDHQRAQRARDAEQADLLGRPRMTPLGAEPWDLEQGVAS